MADDVKRALEQDRVIDIITTGRKSGRPRTTEIWFHNIEDGFFITGTPGRRDWLANLVDQPEFTFHLKESVQADLQARATPIFDNARRREVMAKIIAKLGGDRDLDTWVEDSPLVEVELRLP